MKRVLFAAFAVMFLSVGVAGLPVGVGVEPAFAQNDLVQGGLSLPRSHRYETYEPASGTYTQVDVNTVPDRVAKGAHVYDRTAGQWVNHPSVGGRNPRYAASGSGTVSRGSSDMLRADGMALPRDHKYEVYNTGSGQYTAVDVSSVPSRVQQKQDIYDRTAQAWVYRSSTGMNPQYQAGGGGRWNDRREGRGNDRRDNDDWQRVRGTVERVNGDVVVIKTDDGRTVRADLSQARDRSRRDSEVKPGDRIVVGGVMDGNRMMARFYRDGRQGDSAQDQGDWQRIHGRVLNVEGSRLRFRADDGRTLNVDMSQVNPEVQRALTRDEGATVIGFAGSRPNEFRAEYIQQDSSDPSRGGRVQGQAPAPAPAASASSGSVDEKAWQRIHGRVQSVQGSRLSFKADDGRVLNVDMSQVNPAVQKALTPGEPVTVIGFYQGNDNNVSARFIQQDSSDPAASPKTK